MADPRHSRGFTGEQNMGFILGQEGYEFIDGPSGAGGHGVTTSGFDGVAYNPRTGDLLVGDNKSLKRFGNVTSATAIDPEVNLQRNLQRMINHIENNPNLSNFPNRATALQRLKSAEQGMSAWIKGGRQGSPNLGGVRLVVFNAGGNSNGVGGKLGRTGLVQFEDLNAPRVRVADSSTPRIRVAAEVGAELETPRVRVVSEAEGLGTGHVSMVRSAVIGAVASVGSGLLLGFLQSAMKDKIKSDLGNLPQPKPDPRSTSQFFKDPNTARATRLLDLWNRNLKPFGDELEQHHARVIAGTTMELMLRAASRGQSVQDRLEAVADLRSQLRDYGEQLLVIRENIDAALALKDKTLTAANGADQVHRVLQSALIADQLLQMGMEYQEIMDGLQNLEDFSSSARRVFPALEDLKAKVDRMDSETTTLFWQLVKVSWAILLEPPTAGSGGSTAPKPQVSLGSQRVLAAMGPGTPWLTLSQIKARVKQAPGDFVPERRKRFARTAGGQDGDADGAARTDSASCPNPTLSAGLHDELLALVVHKVRCSINTAFPLDALKLFKSVGCGLAPVANLRGRTRCAPGLLHDAVNFTVLQYGPRASRPASSRYMVCSFLLVDSLSSLPPYSAIWPVTLWK